MTYRIGLIVPSSNTTMETEIPQMLQQRMTDHPEDTFTFHSSRMRMQKVTAEELKRMDTDSERCAIELADARCDAVAYACLIGIVSQGANYHEQARAKLSQASTDNQGSSAVVTSAGALLEGIRALGAKKVAIVTPYMKPLTQTVIDYLQANDIQVTDSISLEIPDNLEVGARDPMALTEIVKDLDVSDADAVVLSACVQMPSLAAIDPVEKALGLPVLSAATSTVYVLLKSLGLVPTVPRAGQLLSGKIA